MPALYGMNHPYNVPSYLGRNILKFCCRFHLNNFLRAAKLRVSVDRGTVHPGKKLKHIKCFLIRIFIYFRCGLIFAASSRAYKLHLA